MSCQNPQHKRKFNHDYCAPWKYHITITKDPSCPDFSSIAIDELTPDGVRVVNSKIGSEIWRGIRKLPSIEPAIQVYQYIIMPDHLHLLLSVNSRMPRHLGIVLHEFKTWIANTLRHFQKNPEMRVFTDGYNDRIIYPHRKLEDIFSYIRQNPYRLAVRRMRPDFFERRRNIFIDGREIQAYGNLFHLRNPFKYSLVIHRKDDTDAFNKKLDDCLYYAENGGVIVSAFISPREKAIRERIEEINGKVILIHDRPFAAKEKPARHNFELCSSGLLLLVSPLEYLDLPKSGHPPRGQCLDMNSLAEKIAGWNQG